MDARDVTRLQEYLHLIVGGDEQITELVHAGLDESTDATFSSTNQDAAGSAVSKLLQLSVTPESVSPELYAETEAIIELKLRPAMYVQDGSFKIDAPYWNRLEDGRENLLKAIRCVGRVELPKGPAQYGGTGFVVGPGLVMTNRHVAEVFAQGLGQKLLRFKDGRSSAFNFSHEHERTASADLRVTRVVMIHPYWDMALLEVDGFESEQPWLDLSDADARDLGEVDVCVIGYPAFDPRNPADVQSDLFKNTFGVKRIQPGRLHGAIDVGSFGKIVHAVGHDCSTLGGNSGSAVVDPKTGKVLAVHFGGAYRKTNYGVPSSELLADARVLDAGVSFQGTRPSAPPSWSSWWSRADAAKEERSSDPQPDDAPSDPQTAAPAVPSSPAAQVTGSTMVVDIPIRITVTIGDPRISPAAPVQAAVSGESLEAMVQPWHDDGYAGRKGYDEAFLSKERPVPMPTVLHPQVLAKTESGDTLLHYQNFSIAMHARRRLALYTASNVTKEDRLRAPDPAASYSRAALSGLKENDREKWFPDPRLDAKYQLPDVFFTKDRNAFDKGHIVRREDVAWGRTYAALRRANGDTYHVTNCSPQIAAFNQSTKGKDNWGRLENVVLAGAKSERLCVFAGPVLSSDDPKFTGVGDGGVPLIVPIPQAYWKIVVADGDDGLEAFGFVLEQDLSSVEMEFVVPENFIPKMARLDELQSRLGLRFSDEILVADQYDSLFAAELVRRGDVVRSGGG